MPGPEGQGGAAAQVCGAAAGWRTEAEVLHRYGHTIQTGRLLTGLSLAKGYYVQYL